jgi:hypothetical protein
MIRLVKNHLPNLIKRFKDLEKKTFSVGYYPENGIHPSGLSYAGLFVIHSFGAPSVNIPPRPVLDLEFSTFSPLDKNIMLKNQLKLYFSNIKSKTPKISVTQMLTNVAGAYVESTRDSFGDSTKLTSNAQSTQNMKAALGLTPNSPLVWTGDLRANLSYSINNQTVITP